MPTVREINPNDSVVFKSAELSYKVYKNGKLDIENGIAINQSDSFYEKLDMNGYLDFDYYRNK